MSLVPTHSQPAAIRTWNDEQLGILKRQIAKGCTDDELEYFAQACAHQQLDPFRGEIVAISRYSGKEKRNVMSIQITVEGLRTIAERSGLYAGSGAPQWCGPDMVWQDVWLNETTPPAACRVAVHRHGWSAPAIGVVRYASFVQLDGQGGPTPLWKKMPDHMLAKAAEAAALKKAFPKELARAGVNVRDLSDAQRVVIETHAAGLNDDDRHELIAEITDGRTGSSRDLTDEERLAVRTETARLKTTPEQHQDWYQINGWADRAEHTAYRQEIARRVKAATPEKQAAWAAFLTDNNISMERAHTKTEAGLVGDHVLHILTPEAPGPAGVIDELYATTQARLDELTTYDRERLAKTAGEQGIPPDKQIRDLAQDQLRWLNTQIDRLLEEPF